MHNIYTHMHLQRRRDCGGRGMQLPCFPALAFLDLWPPSPSATIHGPFASPGTCQCRKDGINAPIICIFPVGASLVIPGAARWQLFSNAGIRRQLRAQRRSTTQQLSGCQGSSWVSGLLVGVCWRLCCSSPAPQALLAPALLKPRQHLRSSRPADACALLAPCC